MKKLKEEFNLLKTTRVPHLTLVYNFNSKISDYKLAKIIKETASDYENLDFLYEGWDSKETENGHVFTFKIKPSDALKNFRDELYQNIKDVIVEDPRTKAFNQDSKDTFWYHASVATRLSSSKAKTMETTTKTNMGFVDKIQDTLKGNPAIPRNVKPAIFPSQVHRIPILKSSKIRYEYDKFTDKILKRHQALSLIYKKETLSAFRLHQGLEAKPHKLKDQTWLVSDTHFNHKNIIGFCGRPFSNIREMNKILISNWNTTVKPQDHVYFLGDLNSWRDHHSKEHWLKKLNGDIEFIFGNHETDLRNTKEYKKISHKGYKFLLTHIPDPDPAKVSKSYPLNWRGWIVHGHKHNGNCDLYPLINQKKKTINLSVEMIKYTPISLDKIVELIQTKEKRMVL